ncbi:MAG: thiol-disulfide isomerase [Ignavibacteria bacterium GWA2_35_9]|nr:MAG: thiol-disulfide isomerase [Ignavibacteria bacterium GWA2_35_9]OGU47964.1 MAG: thiol-disulfide isomerase [Ignavibacteria bacterium GWB2_36_8]OGU53662.1 MAG: thiol-disulfide isomerase [Ignavibacteria bacterium GWC2_36_12]
MIRAMLIIIFSVVLSGLSSAQSGSKYTSVTEFDPARNPSKDLEKAVEEAKVSNRRIILDVGGEWCIWCHRIDDFIEENKDIKNFIKDNFVVVKINFSKENENTEFLSKYPEIPGYPHFFVLESNGKLLHSQDTGQLEQGKGYSHEKMMAFLKKWSPQKD